MSESLSRAEAIFHAVSEAPRERREVLLAELCAGDSDLRALVERLLAHDDGGMPGFLHAAARSTVTELPTPPASPHTPIGPYEILEVIAEGGMGTVYAARQRRPVERDVAVKVIRAGMDSKEVIARFEAERQALALMDHPNIAKVLDAGETPQGQPYFVMELIRGVPITEYCDRSRLTTRERLELFRPVCDAVQHAHQKGIIHRDLKPSNVLVAEVDGRPLRKVIDFGVAKATGRRLTARTMHTSLGVMIGTLEYMSPEQANLTIEDVDTRADVYSLGVILYELLVGALPLDWHDTNVENYEAIRRKILLEDAPRPSTRAASAERSVERARARGTDAPALRRQLQGDLDWIVMKALEKDRARRYATPAHLSADIGRYLEDEPVEARPPTAAYRVRKFVRRHRLGVTAAALVTLALVAAVVGTSAGLVRARRAEALARAEQRRSEEAAAFLASTLSGIDATSMGRSLAAAIRRRVAGGGGSRGGITAQPELPDPTFEGVNMIDETRSLLDAEILSKAIGRIERELEDEPALAADLYHAIGKAYASLYILPPALECSERAVRLSERARGADDPVTNDMRLWLGGAHNSLGRYRDAERVIRAAYESLRRTLGEDARPTLIAMSSLGWIYQQDGQAATTRGSTPGSQRIGRPNEAEPIFRQCLDRMRRVLGSDDPTTLYAAHGLGLALRDMRRGAEAEALLRDTIERMTRVLGAANGATINTRLSLVSVVYYGEGRHKEGESMALELLESSRRTTGNNGFLALLIETKLGVIYMEQGRYGEAEELLRHSARTLPLVAGEQNQFTQEATAALTRLEALRSHREAPGSAR